MSFTGRSWILKAFSELESLVLRKRASICRPTKHRSSRIMSLTFVFRRDRLRGGFKSWGVVYTSPELNIYSLPTATVR